MKDAPKVEVSNETTLIIGNYTLQAQLPNGRSISIAGYIYEKDAKEEVEQRLDMLQEVIERQRIRCEIPELEAKREQQIQFLGQVRDVLADLERRQQEGQKLSSQDKMTIRNHQQTIRKINEEIDKGAQAIAEAKKKAGVK